MYIIHTKDMKDLEGIQDNVDSLITYYFANKHAYTHVIIDEGGSRGGMVARFKVAHYCLSA